MCSIQYKTNSEKVHLKKFKIQTIKRITQVMVWILNFFLRCTFLEFVLYCIFWMFWLEKDVFYSIWRVITANFSPLAQLALPVKVCYRGWTTAEFRGKTSFLKFLGFQYKSNWNSWISDTKLTFWWKNLEFSILLWKLWQILWNFQGFK